MSPACRVCGGTGGEPFAVREMMHGTREVFGYFECGACGCIQIADVPADLSRHYPPDYHSFAPPAAEGRLRRWLKERRAAHVLGRRNPAGMLLARSAARVPLLQWSLAAGLTPGDAVLDVGCGAGHLLRQMRYSGFRDLTGIDPFLRHEETAPGFRLLRRTLGETEGRYRLVMLHHSFEHMADPADALGHVARLLGPGGVALVRIPVAGSAAWRLYGPNWVQLDAPRHLFLHTPRSLGLLARGAGLRVERVVHDSSAFQFWGSELYQRDVALVEEAARARHPNGRYFSEGEMEGWEERAALLNRAGEGDQAAFYLRPATG